MPVPLTVARVGLTVDLALFLAYGRAGNSSAMLKAALLLNPGVAALGPELPLGTVLMLPDAPRQEPVAPADAVYSMFDD